MSALIALSSRVPPQQLGACFAATRPTWVWLGAVALATVLSLTLLLNPPDLAVARVGQNDAAAQIEGAPVPALMSTSDPAALQALTPQTALAINAARPIWAGNNPAARSFSVPLGDKSNFRRSLDCLTAAIYYEASGEAPDGQRAVAQVVLNRVRHPAYPHSICGVVFQGSERSTGCQFSFTCDGSLARIPGQASWEQARKVAEQALKGKVYRPVGLATHYHADYVIPWWADSLVKLSAVGRHIFYRFGAYNSASMLNSAYAGKEPLVFQRATSGAFALVGAKRSKIQPAVEEPAETDEPAIKIHAPDFATIRLALENDSPAKTQAGETGRAYLSAKAAADAAKPAGANRITGYWLPAGKNLAPVTPPAPRPVQAKPAPEKAGPEITVPQKSDNAVAVLAGE